MSIVTFWNADREQSGVSISTVAVATKMAIERNLKVCIICYIFWFYLITCY